MTSAGEGEEEREGTKKRGFEFKSGRRGKGEGFKGFKCRAIGGRRGREESERLGAAEGGTGGYVGERKGCHKGGHGEGERDRERERKLRR